MDIVGTKTVKKHKLLIKLSRGNMGKDRSYMYSTSRSQCQTNEMMNNLIE